MPPYYHLRMGKAELRRRLLLALGVPACWTQASPPAKPEPTPPPVAYQPKPREPEIVMFDAKTCAMDTIVETVCGRQTGEYCTATAKNMELSNNAEGLYVTAFADAQTAAQAFILDDHASEAFVVRLQTLGQQLEGKPACCYSRCTPLVTGVAKQQTPPPNMMRTETCIPKPPAGTALPEQTNPQCPQGVTLQGELRAFSTFRNDTCCYATFTRRVIIRGRPARVDGETVRASLADDAAWHAEVPCVSPDNALAAKWLEAARMEHASIAAFSATSLRLLALGAPPELVAATHRAALDEIEHARIAFALASQYAGRAISPGEFVEAPRALPRDLRALAIETFVDGCIGESGAALEAYEEAAANPRLASVLERIAEDETRHAELAWQIVQWCVQRDRAILDALVAPDDDLGREVIAPCLEAL